MNDSMTGIHRMIGMTGIPVATRMERVTHYDEPAISRITGLSGMTEMTRTRLIPCLTPQSQNKVSHTSLEG